MSIVIKSTDAYLYPQTVYKYYGFAGAAKYDAQTGLINGELYAPVDPAQEPLWQAILDPNSPFPALNRNLNVPQTQEDLWWQINRSTVDPYRNQDAVTWATQSVSVQTLQAKPVAHNPEPGTCLLFIITLLLAVAWQRRKYGRLNFS